MIKLVVADISSLAFMTGEDKISEKIEKSKYLEGLLERTRHPMLAIERTGAYLCLFSFYRRLFGEEPPEIERDEAGRPAFVSGNYDFNISHSGNLVAIAISDDSIVGVDVEEMIDGSIVKNIETRYTSRINTASLDKPLPSEIEIYYATIDGTGELVDYRMIEVVTFTDEGEENIGKNSGNVKNGIHFDAIMLDDCTSSKWSVAESALKCRGSGFANFFDTGAVFPEEISTKAYRLTLSIRTSVKTYYLAISAKPKLI